MDRGRRWGALAGAATVAALLGIAALAAPAAAAPAALFASPTGSDTATSCTNQNAPCSLTHVLSKAGDGDDLTVLPGTYQLTAQLQNAAILFMHGLAGAPRPLIVAHPGAGTIGITLGAAGGSLRHLSFAGDMLRYVLDANFATIEDVSVSATNVTEGGLRLEPGALLRDSSVFVTTSSPNVFGIDDFGQRAGGGGDVRNVTAVVTGSAGSIGLVSHNALSDPNEIVSAENVIAQAGSGVGAVNPGGAGTHATLTIDHSYFNGNPVAAPMTGATVTVTNPVKVTPLLRDTAHGDFHELAGSPTIDAGIDDPANGDTDLDGNPRTLGGATDVGAYEFAPPPTATTLSPTIVTPTGATLAGSINPNGTPAAVSFVLDSGPGAPQTISAGTLQPAATPLSVTQPVTGLTPGSTYTYHVHAVNSGGPRDGGEATFTTSGSAPGLGAGATQKPPVLSAVSISNHRFRVGRTPTAISAAAKRRAHQAPVGTTFRYTLNEAAGVSIAFSRVLPGRVSKGRCVAPTRNLAHAKRCPRTIARGTLTRHGKPGGNTVPFTGRIGSSALAPGSYVATLRATDAAGLRSTAATVSFTVTRG